MRIVLNDLRDGYVVLLDKLLTRGVPISSRSLPVLEVTGCQLHFPDVLWPLLPIGIGRQINTRLAAVEALQLIAGTFDADLIQRAAPTFSDVLVDPQNLSYGAYGPRVGYAIGDCLDLLRRDPGTRQAVVSIWRPEDLEHAGDKPCTVFLQFLIRQHRPDGYDVLDMFVYMRSQDAWLGVPYDIFMFSQLQHTIARELRIPTGSYTHTATSMHIYESDVPRVRTLVNVWQHTDVTTTSGSASDFTLPLGVVVTNEQETGFDVADHLLSTARPDTEAHTGTVADREANLWYFRRMRDIRRWGESADQTN